MQCVNSGLTRAIGKEESMDISIKSCVSRGRREKRLRRKGGGIELKKEKEVRKGSAISCEGRGLITSSMKEKI
jgi:hypothetical protein